MKKFHLETQSFIQGTFEPKPLNLALVFQVNCPGCFAYALPFMYGIRQKYGDGLGMLAVSTAFEDFELNTEAHTRLLLKNGTTVGETQKYLNSIGKDIYETPIPYPVAFDRLVRPKTYLTQENITEFAEAIPDYASLSPERKSDVHFQLTQYYKGLKGLALTFTKNQLKGTPSFILFDADYTIHLSAFGHSAKEKLQFTIETKLREINSLS